MTTKSKKKTKELYLEIELMKTSLSKLVKESGELSYIFFIDFMHKISRERYWKF